MTRPGPAPSGPATIRSTVVFLILVAVVAGPLAAALIAFGVHALVLAPLEALRIENHKDRLVFAFVMAVLSTPMGPLLVLWLAIRRWLPDRVWTARVFAALAILIGIAITAATAFNAVTGRKEIVPITVDFEIRLPVGLAVPPEGPYGDSHLTNRIGVSVGSGAGFPSDLAKEWLRRDGERAVLIGWFSMQPNRPPDVIQLSVPRQPLRRFVLDFRVDPPGTGEFGPWRPVAFVRERGEPEWRAANDDTTELRLRYR